MTALIALLAPAVLIVAALIAFQVRGLRPRRAVQLAEWAGIAAFGVAVAAAALVMTDGAASGPLLGWATFGFAPRLDALTAVMMLLVSAVGWVVLRYSATYLDGEAGQGAFTGWLCLTLASVLLLVQSGTLPMLVLAWIATSLFLHRLLVFYQERPAAQRAARKKAITARASDLSLLVAALLLTSAYGTGEIGAILAAAGAGETPTSALWAAGLLALAAVLKSAQFPMHGWLTEVMETPTPVSALLHAGVINAGGFLLIRFADVILLAPGVLAALALIGGFTALFGGLVMLTQPAVKTSLAWSTISQMGFMILQCGLALFPLALLHIVAHSLYKAHAFLASGGAIERIVAARRPGPVAVPGVGAVAGAFAVALLIYAVVGFVFALDQKAPQTVALGAILIFGVAYLLAQGFAGAAPAQLMRRTAVYAFGAAVGYFALQTGAETLMSTTLPIPPEPGLLEWAVILLAVASFGAIAIAQAMLPLWADRPLAQRLRVHLANGLYVNAAMDRALGGWTVRGKV